MGMRNDLLNSIPELFKTIIDKKDKDILSKYKIVEQKIKDFDLLISKYKEQIDLGGLHSKHLENKSNSIELDLKMN